MGVRNPRISGLLVKFALVVVGGIVSIILVEGALRVIGYQPSYYYPRFLFVEDPTLGYRLRPGFRGRQSLGEFKLDLEINSLGLRGPEPRRNEAKTYSILGLGDSFTFGTGVSAEETYLAVLEELLRSERHDLEVINAGVPGYGTRQELAYLIQNGARFHPSIVLLGFYALNDPDDNVEPDSIVRDGFLVSQGADAGRAKNPGLMYQWKAFLRTHSYTYSYVVNHLKESPVMRRVVGGFGLGGDVFPVEVQFYLDPPPPPVRNAWQVTFALLGEMDSAVRRLNARLVVILIPSRAQVYPEWWRRVLTRYSLSDKSADALLPTRTAAKFLEENGIAYLDLLPEFRRLAEAGHHLYFDLDGHWNREGHRVAAVAIREYLLSQHFVPGTAVR